MTVYNEIDTYAAQWLRNLIDAGHLPVGNVDERDIREIENAPPIAHFFAGIGGWPYAMRLAGWPDDAPVWTGSCPCQPFSAAGRRKGADDERHLWPAWYSLIKKHLPPTIFGEQVASRDGRLWLDAVFADLEALGYAVGAADLCAASVGAPHIRQRLFWVAYTDAARLQRGGGPGKEEAQDVDLGRSNCHVHWADADWLTCRDGKTRPTQPGLFPLAHGVPRRVGKLRAYGNAIVPQVAATFIKAAIQIVEE